MNATDRTREAEKYVLAINSTYSDLKWHTILWLALFSF